jgi:hypothetical protein
MKIWPFIRAIAFVAVSAYIGMVWLAGIGYGWHGAVCGGIFSILMLIWAYNITKRSKGT